MSNEVRPLEERLKFLFVCLFFKSSHFSDCEASNVYISISDQCSSDNLSTQAGKD